MEDEVLRTNDLYYGAYLMVRGNTLSSVYIDSTLKNQVVFCFTGEQVIKSAHEYISGRAKANVNQLRASIDHLKRLAYQKLEKA